MLSSRTTSAPGVERLLEFVEAGDFDFDLQRVWSTITGGGDGPGDPVGGADGGEVVVLDEDAVGQAEPVVVAATVADGLLLKRTHPGRRFPGVDDSRVGSGDTTSVLGSDGGDTAQALEEVECDTLTGEQRLGRTADPGDDRSRLDGCPVGHQWFDDDAYVDPGVDSGNDSHAGDDTGLLDEELAG